MAGPTKRTIVERAWLIAQLEDVIIHVAAIEKALPDLRELTAKLIEIDGELSIENAVKSVRVLARTVPADATRAKKFPADQGKKKG